MFLCLYSFIVIHVITLYLYIRPMVANLNVILAYTKKDTNITLGLSLALHLAVRTPSVYTTWEPVIMFMFIVALAISLFVFVTITVMKVSRRNINISTRSGDRQARSRLTTKPDTEKIISEETEVACIHRYMRACLERLGKSSWCSFHQTRGSASNEIADDKTSRKVIPNKTWFITIHICF